MQNVHYDLQFRLYHAEIDKNGDKSNQFEFQKQVEE